MTDDADRDEMDPSEPVEALSHLIKNAADLQIRIVSWRVLDAKDYDFLQADIRALAADVDGVMARVDYEKERMGL